MRILEFKDITEAFREIELFFGKEWILVELEKLNSQKPNINPTRHDFLKVKMPFHPFILTWRNALRDYDTCITNRYLRITQDLLEITLLGDYLKRLKNIGLLDAECNKIGNSLKELNHRFKDHYEFEKVRYELQIAATYSLKYETNFVNRTNKKTPDFYINYNGAFIQIECKKKDNLSLRDKNNNEIWTELAVEFLNFMAKNNLNYLLIVRFNTDPNKTTANQCLDFVINLLDKRLEGVFQHNSGFSAELEIISKQDEIINPSDFQKLKRNEYFDNEFFSVSSNEMGISEKSLLKNPRFVCFKSNELPDRITSVISSYKKAKKQLSENFPGLIYIEMNPVNFRDEDFVLLERKIKNNFIKKVNAVILTVPPSIDINVDFGQYSHKSKVILNPNTRFPLPEGFEIIGL